MNEEDKNQKLLKKQLKNLNDKTKHIQKIMEKGKDTVVVRIGVQFTEFGFANSDSPLIIPTNLISAAKWESLEMNPKRSMNNWEKASKYIENAKLELNEIQNKIEIGRKGYIFELIF
jgi:exonuclease VII small subunit